ncbi:MAG TPA: hypothetical protein VLT88_09235 [Desulfosarcina sp.]|nr:hypothetical protein [Desulfosarcina sp.]
MNNKHFRLAMALLLAVGLLMGSAAVAAEKAKMGPQTIQGKVEQGDKGITMIKTDDGQAFTILGQNMAAMIGKTVKVTGTVSKGKATRSIMVTSFEEIQE